MNAFSDKPRPGTRIARLKKTFNRPARNPMEQGKLVRPKTRCSVSNFTVIAEVTAVEQETAHVYQYHVKRISYWWKLRRRTSIQNFFADLLPL